MQLLTAWKDSLTLFKPANFSLFFLVTLKSLISTYKTWFTYWWWLIGGYLIASLYSLKFHSTDSPLLFLATGPLNSLSYVMGEPSGISIEALAGQAVLFLLWLTLFLSCRASVKLKNYSYFAAYWLHALFLAIFFALLAPSVYVLWSFFEARELWRYVEFLYLNLGAVLFVIVMMSWGSTVFLCVLDTSQSLSKFMKAVWRAGKMVLYNLPFYLLMILLLILIYAALYLIVSIATVVPGASYERSVVRFWNTVSHFFDVLVTMPIVACIMTNFYIKKIHDQFTLYFGEKS